MNLEQNNSDSRVKPEHAQDWVKLFEILIKVDKRNNPKMYENNRGNSYTD
jgi:hypothetical protein